MLDTTIHTDPRTGEDYLVTSLRGYDVLNNPFLNKGTAFTPSERTELALDGLLPAAVKTIEQQRARAYEELNSKHTLLEKNVFLTSLHDHNETLFFDLLQQHLSEIIPLIYTPVVGEEIQQYSHIYPRPRGLYLSYPSRSRLEEILTHRPFRDVALICVTDGERILGLGDQGAGGIGIAIGKLILYTACAGIHPATTLPVGLDVGTNNLALLEDPHYLGWRHERISQDEYDDFIEQFVTVVQGQFPNALLHWEDFAKANATRHLERYRHRLCTFNDDIQGTGAVTLATLLAALQVTGQSFQAQRIVFFGAGTAGIGIAEQLRVACQQQGLSEREAYSRLYLVNHGGLLQEGQKLLPFQLPYAKAKTDLDHWQVENRHHITLEEVVKNVHPTILIGVSSQAGAFTREIIGEMAAHIEHPIILPLSNPNARAEAQPEDLMQWTRGRALVATGSPFPPVIYGGRSIPISQCNNAYIFPGLGLGVLATKAKTVTEGLLHAAAQALSQLSPALHHADLPLLPPLENSLAIAREIARSVGREAYHSGLAQTGEESCLERQINDKIWKARYVSLRSR
jgi:malate dehydrogenase (oxaloacetate-decarboxylating)